MTTARHIVALLRSHVDGDEERFLSVATHLAAHEARQGHGKLAQELRELIDAAKARELLSHGGVLVRSRLRSPRANLAAYLLHDIPTSASEPWCLARVSMSDLRVS
jgi:hypothetical protein